MDELRQIGNRIRIARTMAGLTQAQLAEKADLTLSSYVRYERAENSIDIISLKHVAKVLGVSFVWIVDGDVCADGTTVCDIDGFLSSFSSKQLEFFCRQMEETAENIYKCL